MSTPAPYDVAILGGGAAGLTLALQLHQARPGTRIAVLERATHPVPEVTHKVGESTVEIAAHYLRSLGLESHLQDQQLHKFGLRMFFSDEDNQDITRRVELGHARKPPYGVGTYQLDRGRLENALGRRLLEVEGIDFRTGVRVNGVRFGPAGTLHEVDVVTADEDKQSLQAHWVIDATGRAGTLRRQLGLAGEARHHANAVWFRVGHAVDVDQWSDDEQWHARIEDGRRELSTNHLMGDGYWVWIIRLASGSTSIGIVTDGDVHPFDGLNRQERAMAWLRVHEPQCARELERHDDVQDFRVMRDYSYTSEQLFSADGWCLAGESGIFLDPLYSPGLDLIAMSNGLITDLVTHALDGEDVAERATVHNRMFLLVADGWFRVYEKQYALMGNARTMLAKVVWDTAVYWSVPGLLYFHGMLPRLVDFPRLVPQLARMAAVNENVQRFFREWHAVQSEPARDAFVGFYDFNFMARLHIGMTAGHDDAALQRVVRDNVRVLEQLAGQLISTVSTELASFPDGSAARAQVQLWQADPNLSRLVHVHEQDSAANPIDDGWITLNGRQRVPA